MFAALVPERCHTPLQFSTIFRALPPVFFFFFYLFVGVPGVLCVFPPSITTSGPLLSLSLVATEFLTASCAIMLCRRPLLLFLLRLYSHFLPAVRTRYCSIRKARRSLGSGSDLSSNAHLSCLNALAATSRCASPCRPSAAGSSPRMALPLRPPRLSYRVFKSTLCWPYCGLPPLPP